MTAFFERLSLVDHVTKTGPQDIDVRVEILPLLQEWASRKYFLDSLSGPEWLIPLREARFFDLPPEPVAQENAISYPLWPEAAYLSKVSASAPELVRDIILGMPDTDNVWVIDELVNAAVQMPANVAVSMVSRIVSWIRHPNRIQEPEKIGKLAVTLATGGEVESALVLSRALLELEPDERKKPSGMPEAKARIDTWDYERTLSETMPVVVSHAGIRGLILLCNLLEDTLSISMPSADGEDFSYIWQSAIEDSKESGFGDHKNLLVSAIRDASVRLISEDIATIQRVVDVLEHRRWHVFRRIAFHVLRVSSAPITIIAPRIANRRYFDHAGETEHEYTLLLRDSFGRLPTEGKQAILSWIDEGPEVEGLSGPSGRPATQEDVDRYVARWRYRRLALIAEHLPEPWLKRYLGSRDMFGDVGTLDSTTPTSMAWVGTLSPKTPDELGAMPVAELVDYLQSWMQGDGIRTSSYEGLAERLTQSVAASPTRFAKAAYSFKKLERREYIASVLDGLLTALGKDQRFSWRSVLKLCRWILANPKPSTLNKWFGEEMVQEPFDSERHSIASLMETAFRGKNGPRYTLRKEAWAIIESLILDPGERVHTRAEALSVSSLNSTWCTAIESAIYYANWVKENSEAGGEQADLGFHLIPEVRRVLDNLLDQNVSVQSGPYLVLGKTLPWLVKIDRQWCEDNLHRIFPHGARRQDQRGAAWNTYLKYHQPHPRMLKLLRREFRYSINTLRTPGSTQGPFGDSAEDLAQHLVIYY